MHNRLSRRLLLLLLLYLSSIFLFYHHLRHIIKQKPQYFLNLKFIFLCYLACWRIKYTRKNRDCLVFQIKKLIFIVFSGICFSMTSMYKSLRKLGRSLLILYLLFINF